MASSIENNFVDFGDSVKTMGGDEKKDRKKYWLLLMTFLNLL